METAQLSKEFFSEAVRFSKFMQQGNFFFGKKYGPKKGLGIKAEKLACALETAQQRNKNLHLHWSEFHFISWEIIQNQRGPYVTIQDYRGPKNTIGDRTGTH